MSSITGTLQAIFGATIPGDADVAWQMVQDSPLRPLDLGALAALREAVVQHAGEHIDAMQEASTKLTQHSQSQGTGQRALGGAVALQISQAVAAKATQGPKLQRSVSAPEAKALFDSIAADPNIPRQFIDEGCIFRATSAAKRLEDAGIYSEKILLQPTAGDLRINSDKSEIGFTLAMFHVSACVYVDTEAGIQRRVIDPSLGDAPLTVDAWAAKMEAMGGAPCEVSYMSRFVMMPYDRDKPHSGWDPKDLASSEAWGTDWKAMRDDMEKMGFHEQLKQLAANPPPPIAPAP